MCLNRIPSDSRTNGIAVFPFSCGRVWFGITCVVDIFAGVHMNGSAMEEKSIRAINMYHEDFSPFMD